MLYPRLALRLPALAVPVLASVACTTSPPPQPSHGRIVRGELSNIMAVKGSPCGEVIDYTLNKRMDYKVLCRSGHVYRIKIVPGGYLEESPHEAPGAPRPEFTTPPTTP